MSRTASAIPPVNSRNGPYFLATFDKLMAPVVAQWAQSRHELFWLAPKTFPPLTAAKVVAWTTPEGCPLLFHRDGAIEPLGYLELNPMPGESRHLWLGHCVLCPDHRGQGLGKTMVRLMLDEAFQRRAADRVSLVVFPDNLVAIRCYEANGFIYSGKQSKFFATTGREHVMSQMTIEKKRYQTRLTQPA